MPTIRKRRTKKGETRWHASVRLVGHPPVCNTLSTKSAALKWAKDVEADIRAGRMRPVYEASKHTLADAIERYEAENERIPSRLAWWKRYGALTLDRVTPAMISDARARLMKGGASGPTTNRYLAALSSVLGTASREWLWMPENPVSKVRRKPERPGRVRSLAEDERDRLLEACRETDAERLYPLVVFALITGARQGELLGLRWKDVDLSAVPPTAILEHTKNADRRTLVFHEPAASELRRLAEVPNISGYVLGAGLGRPSFPKRHWQAALEAAGIEDFRFHDLRHTAASYLAMSGATLSEIAAFLGHRTLAMVKRYSHLTEQHSAEVSGRMAERFFGAG